MIVPLVVLETTTADLLVWTALIALAETLDIDDLAFNIVESGERLMVLEVTAAAGDAIVSIRESTRMYFRLVEQRTIES